MPLLQGARHRTGAQVAEACTVVGADVVGAVVADLKNITKSILHI